MLDHIWEAKTMGGLSWIEIHKLSYEFVRVGLDLTHAKAEYESQDRLKHVPMTEQYLRKNKMVNHAYYFCPQTEKLKHNEVVE